MTIFSLYIYDRHCTCVYYQDWHRTKRLKPAVDGGGILPAVSRAVVPVPLSTGPDIIRRLESWIHHEPLTESGIPVPSRGIYVHAPIEVRVSDTSNDYPRPFLDFTCKHEPTLLINATLYRPFGREPPGWREYYAAFEHLMRTNHGTPHWAKIFLHEDAASLHDSDDVTRWRAVRDQVDPDGMFVGEWHRRHVLGGVHKGSQTLPLEERMVRMEPARGGGLLWEGEVPRRMLSPKDSEESFDIMQASEANTLV